MRKVMTKSFYKVIGVMSGTSLDGLDVAYCEFRKNGKEWSYKIRIAETIKYDGKWKKKLISAFSKSRTEISKLDIEYGIFIGKKISSFTKKFKLKIDFVSSHGHTIFHQPEKQFTLQIGSGRAISSACRLTVINDFRTRDVKLGGQGAPLVPIGDKLLFSKYDFCLNLGGFANVSFDEKQKRVAFDICPVNIVMNDLAKLMGKEFDDKGEISSRGKVNTTLFNKLNALPYYSQKHPKSLGKEWVDFFFIPVLNSFDISIEDKLRTISEHIAVQIAAAIKSKSRNRKSKILISGGGVYNDFLVQLISEKTNFKIIIPDKKTIEFKEAMIFAFLGVLKMRNEINTLRSVTGAKEDSSGGVINWI